MDKKLRPTHHHTPTSEIRKEFAMNSIADSNNKSKMYSEVELITPVKAAEYLEHNLGNNRNIREHRVAAYARDMASGKWELTPSGIAFDEDGVLVDGQHRLRAVISADTPVYMNVTRNVPHDAVAAIDRGLKRNYSDAAKLAGIKDTVLLNPAFTSMMRRLILFEMGWKSASDSDILRLYDGFKVEVNKVARNAGINAWPLDGVVRAAYLAALIAGVDETDIYAFNQCFVHGKILGDYNTTAAMSFKNEFVNARIKHQSMTNAAKYYGTQNALYYFLKENGYRKHSGERYNIKDKVFAVMKGDNNE